MNRSTTPIYNFRTEETDYIEKDAANYSDYIPQDHGSQANYIMYVQDGLPPRDAAETVLKAILDMEQYIYPRTELFGNCMVNMGSINYLGKNLRSWNIDQDDPLRESSPTCTTTTLEKFKVGITSRIDPLLLETHSYVDMFAEECYMRVMGYIWADPDEIKIYDNEFPEDWWQAFKERWFPQWLKKRYPVKYKLIVINARALYPSYKPIIPDSQPFLRIYRVE